MSMRKLIVSAAAAVLAVAASGCAVLTAASNTNTIAVNTAVQFATAKVIEAKGNASAPGRATQIKAIALEVKGYADGTVSVAQLEQVAQAWVVKLPVSDQILANALIQQVAADLNAKVQNGIVDAAAKAAVGQLMDDIVTACNLYIPAAGSITAAKETVMRDGGSSMLQTSSATLR